MDDYSHIVVQTPFNAGSIVQNHLPGKYPVEVLLRDGEFKRVDWMGFIDVEEAKKLEGAKPVKFRAFLFDVGSYTKTLKRDKEYLQGCLYNHQLWCVLVNGRPRVIK